MDENENNTSDLNNNQPEKKNDFSEKREERKKQLWNEFLKNPSKFNKYRNKPAFPSVSNQNNETEIKDEFEGLDENLIDELDQISKTLDIIAVEKEDIKVEDTDISKRQKYALLKNEVINEFAIQNPINSKDSNEMKKNFTLIKKKIIEIVTNISAIQQIRLSADERNYVVQAILDDILGWGPLQKLLDDPKVSEIMTIGYKKIFIEKNGKVQLSNVQFCNEEHQHNIIVKIASSVNRRIDLSNPHVDARLPDGSRVHAIIPPLAADGGVLTIRKFASANLQMEDLISFGSISPKMSFFLSACVKARMNIVISGGTGSGKTTLLNIMSSLIPFGERIITIEDALELKVHQTHEHVVRLESRPSNVEGEGAVTIRDLIKDSLRMRPDRIIVGECRGGEALDMLQAMNTGHDGSMTSLHSNSPKDAISRLITMVLMSGFEIPVPVVRQYIAGAVDMIVQQSRFPDGSRKVAYVTEVVQKEDGDLELRDIFNFKQTGHTDDGKIIGSHVPSGYIPVFINKFKTYNINFPKEVLIPSEENTKGADSFNESADTGNKNYTDKE